MPVWPVGLMDKVSASGAGDSGFESWAGHLLQALSNDAHALGTDRAKTSRGPTANHKMEERQQQTWPPWPNGQGVGLLIRRLRVRVPQGGAYASANATQMERGEEKPDGLRRFIGMRGITALPFGWVSCPVFQGQLCSEALGVGYFFTLCSMDILCPPTILHWP